MPIWSSFSSKRGDPPPYDESTQNQSSHEGSAISAPLTLAELQIILDRRFGPAFECRPNAATLPTLGSVADSDSAKRAAGIKHYLMVLADFSNRIRDLRVERDVEKMARATERLAWDQRREELQLQIHELRNAKRLSEKELEQLKQMVGSGIDKRIDKNGDMAKEIS